MTTGLRRIAVAAAVVLAGGSLPAFALSGADAAPDDSNYRPSAEKQALTGDKVRVRPEEYRAVEVDLAGVRSTLHKAPAAARGHHLVFRVPTPTGGTERFAVQRTQVMEPGLAADHPEIGTWSGRSLDRRGTTIALDLTPMGFHASVRGPSGQGAWYVDPALNERGTSTHLVYYGAAVDKTEAQAFAERQAPEIRRAVATRTPRGKAAGKVVKQKVYRLALTSDPSYAAYFGTQNVLAEKVTLVNRVNQIYNDDLAIAMQLVNGTDKLNLDTEAEATGANGPCGGHPCFDPGQLDFCDVPTLGRNRVVLGQLIGAGQYDVGHLALGVDGGGIAYLGVVGWDYKGSGCTGLPFPVGDFFAIDYVAHELGHQFSGLHTFNGVKGFCGSPGQFEPTAAVEPGSGSSVMAYAGICANDNLQPHSDPYFSQRSIQQVTGYTRSSLRVTEVQTVSLVNFDTDREQVTLSFPGSPDTETLTRGSTYTRAGIEAAVENLTGEPVTIASWDFDFFGGVGSLTPDDGGFQVIFGASPNPEVYGGAGDPALLQVSSPSPEVSGFVGETARGGAARNGGQKVTTPNHHPKAKAPKPRTIPVRTPFRLTGKGSDRDGDKVTFLWEQNDIGRGTSLVDNTKKTGPLFRVFGTRAAVRFQDSLESPSPHENRAKGNPTRSFPDMQQVLSGNTNARTGRCPKVPASADMVPTRALNCYSEFLPIQGYRGRPGSSPPKLHFRLTVRDGYPHGGGTDFDDVVLRLDPSAGPFLVTSQKATGRSVTGGHRGVVKWAVNGTRPLAKQVRILLSFDGGKHWKHLLAKTANDGRRVVRWPNRSTKKARIMIKAVGNYFFAVNAKGFRIR